MSNDKSNFKNEIQGKIVRAYAFTPISLVVIWFFFIAIRSDLIDIKGIIFFTVTLLVTFFISFSYAIDAFLFQKTSSMFDRNKEECLDYVYSLLQHYEKKIKMEEQKKLQYNRFINFFRLLPKMKFVLYIRRYNEFTFLRALLVAEMDETIL